MSNSIIKPFLAKDVIEEKLTFPLYALPKIDGSFCLIQNNKAYARSLKQHDNLFVTGQYSNPLFEGLRGELAIGLSPNVENLCRNTSSALRSIKGSPMTTLWCFDYVTPETKDLPYHERYALLEEKVNELNDKGLDFKEGHYNIELITAFVVKSFDEYTKLRDSFMDCGYEGIVLRDMNSPHKEGRSSAVKPQLWRWKPYATAEIKVKYIEEGSTNLNEVQKNELGKTKRSTHQENMVSNASVGSLVGSLLEDLKDYQGNVIMKSGELCTVSAGEMTAKERKFYFENPCEILEKIVEFSYMSYGLKDKPRFGIFRRIRSEVDL